MELMIGRVIKPHGIKGEVAIEPTTDEPDIRFAIGEVLSGRQGNKETQLTIKSLRAHQNRLLVTFEEIPDRTAAESLRGMRFFAEPLEREAEDEEGFYDHELIGLMAVDLHGGDLGEVVEVHHGPAGTLLEVDLGEKTALVPFVHQIVPEVDLCTGTVTIDPPEGLLDL